jgi:uncharacterized protein
LIRPPLLAVQHCRRQIAELKFGLQPASILIKKGHRLRIAIAGADKDTFARVPAEGSPTITVLRNKANP